jgi:hypothetical protein
MSAIKEFYNRVGDKQVVLLKFTVLGNADIQYMTSEAVELLQVDM